MKAKKSISIFFIVLIATMLYMSNPSFTDHKVAINTEFKNQNPVLGTIAVGRLIAGMTTYYDFHFFSITKADDELVHRDF